MSHLTLVVEFTIGDTEHDDAFELSGSVGRESALAVIENWLRTQENAVTDTSEPARLKTYHIEIDWNPHNDRLCCRSDCGNESLRDGLLIHIRNKLSGKGR